MVDSMANSVEDYLIDGLSFKLNPGASYVADRRSVSYFPSGSNIYQSGSGARVIRVNLTGEGWLDPSTVRLTYTLVNNEGGMMMLTIPLNGPLIMVLRYPRQNPGRYPSNLYSVFLTNPNTYR